jgi:hypothetical protein
MAKKYYETTDFKQLQELWDKKLEDDGFIDQEDSNKVLKQENDRSTISFEARDRILYFFNKLDHYLNNIENPAKIPNKDREILELYSDGVHVKGKNGIVEQTGWSDKTIRNLINKYKKIVLALPD